MKQHTTVLIVDDIPLMRTILSKHVMSVGGKVLAEQLPGATLEVVEAATGKAAMEALKSREVDLIFLDLMMPEMDGLSFLAIKQQDSAIASIPVVVCSALGEKDTLERAREFGVSSYIVKPFTAKSIEAGFRAGVEEMPED